MFKARQHQLNRDVVSLDPTFSPEQLHTWARQDQLFCPGCNTELNYRRQGVRRAHFSHRANMGCHYNAGDPEVVAARAALYSFLVEKVTAKGGRVDLEVQVPGGPDGDLIDVWLELPGSKPVAYRIFKTGRRPAYLADLESATHQAGAVPRYLLTISRRSFEEPVSTRQKRPRLAIPAPDRHLFFWREWDRYHVKTLEEPRQYASLAYIDPNEERLYLYRNLWRPGDCNPSTHDYEQVHEAALSEVLIYKGELIFPDEKDAKRTWEEWATAERERRRQQAEAERERLKQIALTRQQQPSVSHHSPLRQPTPPLPQPARTLPEQLLCTSCGQMTRDWWTRRRPGEGECRACNYRKQGIEPKFCARCGGASHPKAVLVNELCPDCR